MDSEAELRTCFREIDRDEVELPGDFAFPCEDTRAWTVGPRAFLVFRDPPRASPSAQPRGSASPRSARLADRAKWRGIVFYRNSGAVPEVAAMCDWCHAVRGHGGVKLLSVKTDERRRVGLYLCADLGCVTVQPRGPDDMPDGLDGQERARRALARAADLAARRLF